jgi:hypothetical protein
VVEPRGVESKPRTCDAHGSPLGCVVALPVTSNNTSLGWLRLLSQTFATRFLLGFVQTAKGPYDFFQGLCLVVFSICASL